MTKDIVTCTNAGMNRDLGISLLSADKANYAYENFNIRITAVNDETLYTVTNEKGTLLVSTLKGIFLGSCAINKYIILFTHVQTAPMSLLPGLNDKYKDYIYRIQKIDDNFQVDILYQGDLGFSVDNLIDAVGYYESEEIQKVYWVDGLNSNRFINIADKDGSVPNYSLGNSTQFDFQGLINKIPNVTITKNYNKAGIFLAGVLQYFITYYNKYGVETGIVYQSDLQYISLQDRGAKPDEAVSCSFDFNILNVDTTYEYIRIYAAYRAGVNGTAEGRLVTEIPTKDFLSFADYGKYQNYNADDIYYIGGQNIIASTLDYKQDTLFFGDITLDNSKLSIEHLKELFEKESHSYEGIEILECLFISWEYKKIQDVNSKNKAFEYTQQINHSQSDIAGFKYRELYRFGIQFMSHKGEWTSAIWVGDKYCDLPPLHVHKELEENLKLNAGIYISTAKILLPENILNAISENYCAYRLLVAETSVESRRIITLGVINPTLFNYKDRENNKPFSINSWIFRPRQANVTNRHYDMLHTQESEYAEIQGVMNRKLPGIANENIETDDKHLYNSFMLIFAPNYLAGCRLWYKLVYYDVDTCQTFDPKEHYDKLDPDKNPDILNKVKDMLPLDGRLAALTISKWNQCLKEGEELIPYNFKSYKVVSDRLLKATSWEKIASQVITSINEDAKKEGINLVFSGSMLPTANQYKEAWNVTSTPNAGSIAAIIGLAVAAAVAVVASVFSFGAAAPAAGVAISALVTGAAVSIGTTVGLAAACAASVIAAIGSAAGIGAIAEDMKYDEDAKDIDKLLSYKGIYPIGDHTLNARLLGAELANKCLDIAFNDWEDANPFTLKATNNSLGSDSNFYTMGGSLTLLNDIELDKNSKQDAFYVDESILSFNSPDIELLKEYLNNSDSYKVDLIGNINITDISNDYTMYAEQGLANTAQVIPGLQYTDLFGNIGREGLYNGLLYQDSKWPDNWVNEPDASIQASAAVSAYKVFMWNRNTSWSLWVPDIKVLDVYGNTVELPPAKPIKKIFANIKYSLETQYQDNIYSLLLEDLKVVTSDLSEIQQFEYNGNIKYYQSNVDSIIIPPDNYTLIAGKNEFHKNADTGEVDITMKDIVPLRYKSNPHALLSLKWYENSDYSVLLPLSTNEDKLYPWDLYKEFYGETDVEIVKNKYSINILGSGPLLYVPKKIEDGWADIHYYYTLKDKNEYSIFESSTLLYNLIEGEELNTFMRFYVLYKACPIKRQLYINELWYSQEQSYINSNTVSNFIQSSDLIMSWMQKFEYGVSLFYLEDEGSLCGYIINKEWKLVDKIDYGQGEVPYNGKNIPLIVPIISGNLTYFWELDRKNQKLVSKIEGSTISIEILDREENEGHTYGYYMEGGWFQNKIDWEINNPYLFLGELVKKDFVYDDWYGGYSDYALQLINWNVCSKITSINDPIDNTWGDTYYQRWDCLKTYPFSELEVNSNVEVLSFMLESHINLDGRSDVNKGTNNLINLRPSNSNLFNPVYDLQDNFFSYKVLDEKFDKSIFRNQIVWSLSKSNLDNIDKWTSISAVNTLLLDGKMDAITKIINVNDALLAFLELGISTIDYNLQSALTTYEGVPLLMGNTGKVTGYTKVTDGIGCSNKKAICLSDAGIFFIDVNTKSLYQYSRNEGIANLSKVGNFTIWCKEHLDNTYVLNYDSLTSDLYISNQDTCLLYNTALKSFTSFMSYYKTPLLLDFKGKSIAFYLEFDGDNNMVGLGDNIKLYTLFDGSYNNIYGAVRPYYMEYRINPSPYTDNMFTNYLYIATWESDNLAKQSFDSVEAWNEYQHGILKTESKFGITPLKQKFRIWRGDIPRDGDTLNKRILKGDRMRNPWIHFKLKRDNNDLVYNSDYDLNSKMTFHSLNVTYYR